MAHPSRPEAGRADKVLPGIWRLRLPLPWDATPHDRDLVDGVEVETDVGTWVTHETPGHAPSHVVFHQPERKILLSGDQIVGRVFLFFDAGHTPDPVGEFSSSLDLVEGLDVGLCLSGHGKPFRDVRAKVAANRAEVSRELDRMRAAFADGEPLTIYEAITAASGPDRPPVAFLGYLMEMSIAYLAHLELAGEVEKVSAEPERWVSRSG